MTPATDTGILPPMIQNPDPTAPFSPILVIPARMAATRLPGKPLADIHGTPMIVHVWRRAVAADLGPVVVATPDGPIIQAILQAGGQAVPTSKDLQSGTDRVAAALKRIDPYGDYDMVINLQGDLPTIEPDHLKMAAAACLGGAHVGTLVAEIKDAGDLADTNVVKAAVAFERGQRLARALYFSRMPIPGGDGPHYHHIGVYAYSRAALDRFVTQPRSALESREGLEQLRALDDGMRIDAALVDRLPIGVDTPADLEKVRGILAP